MTNFKLRSSVHSFFLLLVIVVIVCFPVLWKYSVLQEEYSEVYHCSCDENRDLEEKPEKIRICSQTERTKTRSEMCRQLKIQPNQKIQFIVDDKYKAAFCQIEKSGCSTFKLLMANISAGGTLSEKDGPKVHYDNFLNETGLKVLYFNDSKSAVSALQNYTKFTVVRHPLKRLLSGYYDKVLNNNYLNKEWMINDYKTTKYYKMKTNDIHFYPLFPEFVNFIMGFKDNHFNPEELKCDICNIDYDYILKLETLDEELPRFLEDVYGRRDYKYEHRNPQYSKLKSDVATVSTATRLDEFYVLVPELHNDIVNYFQNGIDILGYSYNRTSFTARCGGLNTSVENCC